MSPQHTKPFRFFDLPVELRDEIYDLLPSSARVIPVPSDPKGLTYKIWQKGHPMTYLLLVNKQFRNEYGARARKQNDIRIEDKQSNHPRTFQLPSSAISASSVEFHLSCTDCGGWLYGHVVMVERAIEQMKNAPSVQIRIYYEMGYRLRTRLAQDILAEQKALLDRLVRSSAVNSMDLYVRWGYKAEPDGRDSLLVAKYKTADGWSQCADYKP